MVISSEAVIRKMLKELKQAQIKQNDQQEMMKHISHIRLLCELILEEETDLSEASDRNVIHNVTNDKMMGSSPSPPLKQDDGTSIFDF